MYKYVPCFVIHFVMDREREREKRNARNLYAGINPAGYLPARDAPPYANVASCDTRMHMYERENQTLSRILTTGASSAKLYLIVIRKSESEESRLIEMVSRWFPTRLT